MFSKSELTNFVAFDLETVSGHKSLSALEKSNPHLAELWHKRCDYLRKKHEDNSGLSDEDIYTEKAGLQAEFGKIACISVAYVRYNENNEPVIKTKSYAGEDERELLEKFTTFLSKAETQLPNAQFTGHNIKRFDIPYLCKRLIINGLDIPQQFKVYGKKPWELTFLDTAELWSAGSWQESFTSLDILTTVLGIPTPKSDIDGSEVGRVFWKDRDIKRISTYCEKDCAATLNVLLHISGLGIAEPENVISVD